MINGEGLGYVVSKVKKENEVGQSCALQAVCMISRYNALIPEFLAQGIMGNILWFLHSNDPQIKLYAAEILKNFSTSGQLLNYVDVRRFSIIPIFALRIYFFNFCLKNLFFIPFDDSASEIGSAEKYDRRLLRK